MSKQPYSKFVICPVCQGEGRDKFGRRCSNCAGMGMGKFNHGRFFYWGPQLGRAVIELSRLREKIHLIFNFIIYAVGLLGLISLGVWVYLTSREPTIRLEAFTFWRIKHPLILFFWVSVLADMFIFYRLSEEERKQHRIRSLTYEEKNKKFTTPNNWAELKTAKKKFKIDVAGGFSPATFRIVEEAYLLADKLNHKHVQPLHLFFVSLSDSQVAALFSRLNVSSQVLLEKLKKYLTAMPPKPGPTRLSRTLKEVLIEAYWQAVNLGQKKVAAINFLIPCLERNQPIKDILFEFEVDKQKIFNVILWFIINQRQIESYERYKKMARFKPASNMDRAYTSVATPTLDQLGYDLTLAAKWGKLEYCVAREKEIEGIWQYFLSGDNGVLLVGPPGVGKNTIIDGIAQLMVKENVPKQFQDKRLVELDAARLISGLSPAQAQGRMMAVIDEVARAGNILLYIKDVENIIGITSGEEESLDLSEVLTNALERRLIYCLATAATVNYSKYIEGTSLGTIMAKMEVAEPEGNQAIQIIESKISYFEGKYKVYFSYNAIEQAIKLTSRYIHDQYLPEKAVKILEMVAVRTIKEKGEESIVTKDDIAVVVSEVTKIPVTKVGENESKKLLHLEDKIHERMINQEEAVKMIAASLRRARTELREGKRPIASFLFLGPTGVGKTELAKTVAEVYFGDEDYMVRVDMSEYQHEDSVKKMIGDAAGARGYLTEAVRTSPFTLVLLDEIEKAHPDILNLFLQVMDDGRLTDGQGRTIDFTNTIIIATSNIGARFIQEQIFAGVSTDKIKETLINEQLMQVMRPELINRFDGIVVFEPLSQENVVDITKLMLKKIGRMLEAKGISYRWEEEGVRKLSREGFDPKFGARPLRRLLQEKVEDEIANRVLTGELKRRDTVVINEDGEVKIEKAERV